MSEEQKLTIIGVNELAAKVEEYHKAGYRLVQVCCTKITDGFELSYSFDKDYRFESLRLVLPESGEALQSISSIYWNAFLYENEIHDLFGVAFKDMAIDYQGRFYRMSKKTPFNDTI